METKCFRLLQGDLKKTSKITIFTPEAQLYVPGTPKITFLVLKCFSSESKTIEKLKRHFHHLYV